MLQEAKSLPPLQAI